MIKLLAEGYLAVDKQMIVCLRQIKSACGGRLQLVLVFLKAPTLLFTDRRHSATAKMEKIIVKIIGRIRLIPGVGRYVQHIPAMHGVPLIVKGEFRLTVQGDDQQILG